MILPVPTVDVTLTTKGKEGSGMLRPPSKDFKIYKAVMCQYHASGRCRKGTMCTFAHSSGELRAYPDMRKHKLCAAWLSAAGCPHSAESCMYAHGVEQMQKAKMSAVNKPALCVPFFEGGGCAKGLNCTFAHSMEDVDTAYQATLQRHQCSLLGQSPDDSKQPRLKSRSLLANISAHQLSTLCRVTSSSPPGSSVAANNFGPTWSTTTLATSALYASPPPPAVVGANAGVGGGGGGGVG
eukprot:GHVS01020141.1.p1 GENE.GHVS01020141.1~~GHVS01020141.1.p1  ORF type:complete len:239 (+),score=40.41 GHVS01020141.1:767-1483(+)